MKYKVEEIKPEPKPVDFVSALNSGKHIKPAESDWDFHNADWWLTSLCTDKGIIASLIKEYINGQWLIKE
jgi:hypothetical protein